MKHSEIGDSIEPKICCHFLASAQKVKLPFKKRLLYLLHEIDNEKEERWRDWC